MSQCDETPVDVLQGLRAEAASRGLTVEAASLLIFANGKDCASLEYSKVKGAQQAANLLIAGYLAQDHNRHHPGYLWLNEEGKAISRRFQGFTGQEIAGPEMFMRHFVAQSDEGTSDDVISMLQELELKDDDVKHLREGRDSNKVGDDRMLLMLDKNSSDEKVRACELRLIKAGLTYDTSTDRVWINERGLRLREAILRHDIKVVPLTFEQQAEEDRKAEQHRREMQALRDEQVMDLDFFRDGPLKTCGKLWTLWREGDEIAQRAQHRQLLELAEFHGELEKSLRLIAQSDQRAARRLLEMVPEKVKPVWTEAEQRASNDRYWSSGGASFWLNPMGVLADPTPAPDWWVMPESLESISARRLAALTDDTVALSLLPPPDTGPKGDQGPIVVELTPEERHEKNLVKMLEELNGLELLTLARYNSDMGARDIRNANDLYHYLDDKWDLTKDGPDAMSSKGVDDYGIWSSKFLDPKSLDKAPATKKPRERIKAVGNDKDLYIIKVDNLVKGFATKNEADNYLCQIETTKSSHAPNHYKSLMDFVNDADNFDDFISY